MSASKVPTASSPRPTALIVESDGSFREALRKASQGQDVFETLRQVLASRGYDVVVSFCPDEARRLMHERSFDKIYSDGTLPVSQEQPTAQAPAGPRIEDQGDGTARVQFDQVVPWSVAVELLDLLADQAQDKPQPHS